LAEDSGVHDGAGWGGFTLGYAVTSSAEVDHLCRAAAAAGASITRAPVTKPFGYSGVFTDLDGHTWEVAWVKNVILHLDGNVRAPVVDWHELRALCHSLEGATETFPFGPDTSVFKAPNGKMFAVTSEHEDPLTVSLKVDPDEGEALRVTHASIVPGYHFNKRHWVTVTLGQDAPDRLVRELISGSTNLSAARAVCRRPRPTVDRHAGRDASASRLIHNAGPQRGQRAAPTLMQALGADSYLALRVAFGNGFPAFDPGKAAPVTRPRTASPTPTSRASAASTPAGSRLCC
jgi:predicted DNA-binding protein (MmcQ/YjbR family)